VKTLLIPMVASALFASTSAFALTAADEYGSPAPVQASQRTIVVDGSTRYVNVKQGETVTIRTGDTSISWYFDGILPVFPLSKILPIPAAGKPVQVYVAPHLIGHADG